MHAKTIDEVISILDNIIVESKNNNSPLGYFAVLYKKVTLKVKDGIADNFFDNGPRMEKLDIVFANRYFAAYFSYHKNLDITESWKKTFELSTNYWPIVLQHLLMGMNAHINLDLGIAAAEVSKTENIGDLENDFNKINEILATLVNDVQTDLGNIWPPLKPILKMTGKVDDFIVDFSMKLARDGAWEFAKSIANNPVNEQEALIENRDIKIADKSNIITKPGFITKLLLWIIRLGERGSVSEKINMMK